MCVFSMCLGAIVCVCSTDRSTLYYGMSTSTTGRVGKSGAQRKRRNRLNRALKKEAAAQSTTLLSRVHLLFNLRLGPVC